MFARKLLVLTYHGLHNRELKNSIDIKLFRNSISENAYLTQLKIIRQRVKAKLGHNGNYELVYKDLLFNEFKIVPTFDDGYSNTFRATEIFFDVFGIAPLTVFLTTNLIGESNQSVWTVNVGLLILRGEFLNRQLIFCDEEFSLQTSDDRIECFDRVRNRLKKMNAGDRNRQFDLFLSQTPDGELERLMSEYSEFRMLDLDKIRQMKSMGVKFESHGHNHELLHSNQSPEVIESEIRDSKHFIETELGQSCCYFAYPNGDYCDAAISFLKENGFQGAFTTRVGTAQNLVSNFEIPRITPNQKPHKFKKQLKGKFN